LREAATRKSRFGYNSSPWSQKRHHQKPKGKKANASTMSRTSQITQDRPHAKGAGPGEPPATAPIASPSFPNYAAALRLSAAYARDRRRAWAIIRRTRAITILYHIFIFMGRKIIESCRMLTLYRTLPWGGFMNKRGWYWSLTLLPIILAVAFVYYQARYYSNGTSTKAISEWDVVPSDSVAADKQTAMNSYVIRFTIPNFEAEHPALLFNHLLAQNVKIYIGNKLIRETIRDYPYDMNNFIVAVNKQDMGQTLSLWVQSMKRQLGPSRDIEYGEESVLRNRLDRNMQSVIIGSAFLIIALVMMCCTIFLRKTKTTRVWLVLTMLICTAGILFITYSSYTYAQNGKYGVILFHGFDLALLTFLPALTYFFESIIGKGYRNSITIFRIFQFGYSLFCAVFMAVDIAASYQFFRYYHLFSVTLLGYTIILQFALLSINAVVYAMKGNRDAIIFALGTTLLTFTIIVDLLCYYITCGKYELILWKWGVVLFVITLLVIMGRKLAEYYEQIVNYSLQVELYNNRLQRSEKLEIISELAASIAHEVRNPLQVTRGFLQLLTIKVNEQEKEYMNLAISELDRAAEIITDFLTFAKPQMENVEQLHIESELKQIEGIIIPLAHLHGGDIEMNIPRDLYIHGNSAKFKQAVINIIKNSIEALQGLGQIKIWAYHKEDKVLIHIRDTGEGMDAAALSRLGEPYFSTKTKGTGLGLMVTFRIIEIMGGNIKFLSEKGKGTEVILSFPAAAST
jgi:two-component system sporulation sensor kinase B